MTSQIRWGDPGWWEACTSGQGGVSAPWVWPRLSEARPCTKAAIVNSHHHSLMIRKQAFIILTWHWWIEVNRRREALLFGLGIMWDCLCSWTVLWNPFNHQCVGLWFHFVSVLSCFSIRMMNSLKDHILFILPSPHHPPPPAYIYMHVCMHTHMDTCCVHTHSS